MATSEVKVCKACTNEIKQVELYKSNTCRQFPMAIKAHLLLRRSLQWKSTERARAGGFTLKPDASELSCWIRWERDDLASLTFSLRTPAWACSLLFFKSVIASRKIVTDLLISSISASARYQQLCVCVSRVGSLLACKTKPEIGFNWAQPDYG